MPKLEVVNNILKVKEGLFKTKQFSIDALRLFYLIVPESFKWYVVQSSQSRSFINLDPISDKSFTETIEAVSSLVQEDSSFSLSDIKLIIADYTGQFAIFSLKDIKKYQPNFFEKISSFRDARIKRLTTWLQGNPKVLLQGILWHKAIVDKEGYRKGKKIFVSWNDVETIQKEIVNGMACSFYVLPKGVSGGTFGFAKGKYAISISKSRADLYTAECNFWISLKDQKDLLKEGTEKPEVILEKAVQDYIAAGYSIISRGETIVLEKPKETLNIVLFLVLLLFFFPAAIGYLISNRFKKPYRLKLKLGSNGKIVTEA